MKTYRKIIYIIFGLVPATLLFLGILFTTVVGISENIFMVIYGLAMIYAYICGIEVIFDKVPLHSKARVIAGLIIGIIGCVSYGIWLGVRSLDWWVYLFYGPPIIAGLLIFEVYSLSDEKKIEN